MSISQAVQKAESWMDTVDGVTGVAQGEQDGKAVITVFISRPDVADALPDEFEGYPVVKELSDAFHSY